MDIASLPFNKVLGIAVDGTEVVLVTGPEHLNHVETVHAAVVYGVAEAASGQCLLARFPDLTDSHVAVLRNSTVKYRRPALMGAEVRGSGIVADEAVAVFEHTLSTRGRATVSITVSVSQGSTQLLNGTFEWFTARK